MCRRNSNTGLAVFWVKLQLRRLYPLHLRPVLFSVKERTDGGEVAECQASISPSLASRCATPASGARLTLNTFRRATWSALLRKRTDITSTHFWANIAASNICGLFRNTEPILPPDLSRTVSGNSPLPLSAFRQTMALDLPTGSTPRPHKKANPF